VNNIARYLEFAKGVDSTLRLFNALKNADPSLQLDWICDNIEFYLLFSQLNRIEHIRDLYKW